MEKISNTSGKLLKILFSLFLIITLFSKFLDNIFSVNFFSLFDEFLIVISIIVIAFKLAIKLSLDLFSLKLISCFGVLLLISFMSNYFIIESLFQIFIHLKLFLFFILIRTIYYNDQRLLQKIFYLFIAITFIGLIMNIILQDTFNEIFNIELKYRFDLLRMNGFQLSANNLGISFLIGYLFVIYSTNQRNLLITSIITFVFVLLCLVSGTRTALLIIPFVYLIILKNKFKGILRYFAYSFGLLTLMFFIFIIQDSEIIQKTMGNFLAISDNSDYARGVMIVNSFKLAFIHFPIGSGAASFGSILSVNSPVYNQLGINFNGLDRSGMSEIFDSNFASVLGEFGVIGIFVFLYLFYGIQQNSNNYLRLILISVLFFSFTNPVLMNGYQALIFSIALNIKNKFN